MLTGSYDSASCGRSGGVDNSQDGIADAAASILRFDLTAEGFAAMIRTRLESPGGFAESGLPELDGASKAAQHMLAAIA